MEIISPGVYDVAIGCNAEVVEGLAFVDIASSSVERPGIGVNAVVEVLERPGLNIRVIMNLSRVGFMGTYALVDGAKELFGDITMKPVLDDPDVWRGQWTLDGATGSVTIAPRRLATGLGLAA